MNKELGNHLTTIALAALFVLSLGLAAIRMAGLSTFIVTGGSMEPAIHKGSLVVVEPVTPERISVGDVITFQQYGQTTTHRVVTITRGQNGLVFHTKGDANTVADPEDKTFAGEVGVVRATVPLVGYAIASVQAYWRLALTLLAAVIFFWCAGALVLSKDGTATARRRMGHVARPVLVTIDADAAWRAHVEWVARSNERRARAA